MLVWGAFLLVVALDTLLIAVYALVTRSAGIYQTTRQFWTVLLVSAGVAYPLSGLLALVAKVPAAPAVIISAIVPFLVGNVFSKGDVYSGEDIPAEEPAEAAEADEEMETGEADEGMEAETALLVEEPATRFERFSDLLN